MKLKDTCKKDLMSEIRATIEKYMDDLSEELELSDDNIKHLNAELRKMFDEIQRDIDISDFDIDAKEIAEDGELMGEVLYEFNEWEHPDTEHLERMAAILSAGGYRVIKCQSLAAEIYVDGVVERLEQNPYTPAVGGLFR